MAGAEACSACGREPAGGEIPRRVLGKVLCAECDRARIEATNRRDRVAGMKAVVLGHGGLTAALVFAGIRAGARWAGGRGGEEGAGEFAGRGAPLGLIYCLLPLGAGVLLAWVTWSLWKLEGRGRLVAILIDVLAGGLSAYWLLGGQRWAAIGLLGWVSAGYLMRSATADRFW